MLFRSSHRLFKSDVSLLLSGAQIVIFLSIIFQLALSLVSLALMTPVCAEEKMNTISAEDFAAGMEGLNVDETKHRPIYILPRPFPVKSIFCRFHLENK